MNPENNIKSDIEKVDSKPLMTPQKLKDGEAWREIVRLSVPNVISNITVPLMGMADVAIAGHVGGDVAIGAVAIGTSIFNMIYCNCSFLRMGGSGLTAQAYGAGRLGDCLLTGARSVVMALAISVLLLVLGSPIRELAVRIMGCEGELAAQAMAYVVMRWWAILASVSLFAVSGWFIGMQDSRTPMIVAIVSNIVNVGCSYLFAVEAEMGVSGIALGTVVAQWSGLGLSALIYRIKYHGVMPMFERGRLFEREAFGRLARVNRDIFIRTLCLVTVFTAFTAISSRYGETALAANALIMQLFYLFSYLTDGLAYAGESITGRMVGAGDKSGLRTSVRCVYVGGAIVAAAYTVAFGFWWSDVLTMFGASAEAQAFAGEHIGWGIAVPVVCVWAFVADGVMVGATRSAAMRNTMAIAAVVFFGVYWALRGVMGIDALWLGFLCFMAVRGLLLGREAVLLVH